MRHAPASAAVLACMALAACGTTDPEHPRHGPYVGTDVGFANIPYATWRDDEPSYRLYPGDQIDVALPSAPELSRTLTVQPDGRIAMPLVAPLMAADHSPAELEHALADAYRSQLYNPHAEVTVRQAGPLRVFVGGEVGKPGVYDMPGDIDALQAVVMAGGFQTSAEPRQVVVIRRGADGRPMMRTVDLGEAVRHAPRTDAVPLRRFDVIYVPRSGISNAGLFVQQYLRDLVPVQFSYAVGTGNYLTTR